MKQALVPALFMSAAIVIGNIIYDRKNKANINWKRSLITAGIAFVLVMAIGFVAE